MSMRTIKFRGKRIDNKKWVYGYLADEDYINDINSIDLSSIEVDRDTIGQFPDYLTRTEKKSMKETLWNVLSIKIPVLDLLAMSYLIVILHFSVLSIMSLALIQAHRLSCPMIGRTNIQIG